MCIYREKEVDRHTDRQEEGFLCHMFYVFFQDDFKDDKILLRPLKAKLEKWIASECFSKPVNSMNSSYKLF